MPSSVYRTKHNGALMKASARLAEAREFIASFDSAISIAENAKRAYQERWYGNASEAVCRELTRFFNERFNFFPSHLTNLKIFLSSGEGDSFAILNHFYMIITDPYYRWAAADYVPSRLETGLMEIPRRGFEQEARGVLPEILNDKTVGRYCRNILTALRDNGFLAGLNIKTIVSPVLSAKTLGFILYSLSDFGEGFNAFDGSPVFRSLLKQREFLVPLFQEGQRKGWWEFTGDRTRLSGNLQLNGLAGFLEEVGI